MFLVGQKTLSLYMKCCGCPQIVPNDLKNVVVDHNTFVVESYMDNLKHVVVNHTNFMGNHKNCIVHYKNVLVYLQFFVVA